MAVKSERMESLTMHGNMTILYLCHFGAVYLTIGGGDGVGGEMGFYVLLESYSFFPPHKSKIRLFFLHKFHFRKLQGQTMFLIFRLLSG